MKLNGMKTYIIGCCMILFALFGLFLEKMGTTETLQLILEALAVMGLRHGITTTK